MTLSTRQNEERWEKWKLGKQKQEIVRNTLKRMEGCKRKIETNKDAQVLMNEDKKEIVFQERQFLIAL
jgi:hypothetical protein